jgi:hypothetical protein
MQSDGSFQRRIPEEECLAVQATLIERWRRGLSDADGSGA